MRKILMVLGIMALICSPAMAGKNAGGAMVVHTNDAVNYTGTANYCAAQFNHPGTCETAGTQTNKPDTAPAVVWFIAAFHETAAPGVTVCYFGNPHNLPPGQGYFQAWGFCAPANGLEVPDPGWPEQPATAGNSVASPTAWPLLAGKLFPFYWFAAYGFEGAHLGTGNNPVGGYAAFVSDDVPGILDVITKFGRVRWYTPGANECPTLPQILGACCFPDGTCQVLPRADCEAQGGAYQGDETICTPNPCPQPGACCFEDGTCTITLPANCTGQFLGGVCDPNPCPQPPRPGACCYADGSCAVTLPADCTGEFQGEGTECDPNPCPQPPETGACCLPTGACEVLTAEQCAAANGQYQGDDVPCDPNPCPPVDVETTTWGSIKANYR